MYWCKAMTPEAGGGISSTQTTIPAPQSLYHLSQCKMVVENLRTRRSTSGGMRHIRRFGKSRRKAVSSLHDKWVNSRHAANRLIATLNEAFTSGERHRKFSAKLGSKVRKYAEICDAVYYKEDRRQKVAAKYALEIDIEFSTDRSILLLGRGTSGRITEVILCFRGTKVTNVQDLQTDIAIIRGREIQSDLFKTTLLMSRAAIQKYGKRGLVLTGHSMAATAAMYVSRELSIPAEVFNPGSSGLDLINKVWKNVKFSDSSKPTESEALNKRASEDKSLVNVYIVRGDFLSNFLLYNDKVTHKVYVMDSVKGTGAHSLDNFIQDYVHH